MSKTTKLKNPFFNKSLQLGLLKFMIILLTYYKGFRSPRAPIKNIIGVKIECSGRWKKTKSARTQKLCFNYGQTKKIGVVNTVFFSFLTQKTKYASCGFKVWFTFK